MQELVAVVAVLVLAALLTARMSREQARRRQRGKTPTQAKPTVPSENKNAEHHANVVAAGANRPAQTGTPPKARSRCIAETLPRLRSSFGDALRTHADTQAVRHCPRPKRRKVECGG